MQTRGSWSSLVMYLRRHFTLFTTNIRQYYDHLRLSEPLSIRDIPDFIVFISICLSWLAAFSITFLVASSPTPKIIPTANVNVVLISMGPFFILPFAIGLLSCIPGLRSRIIPEGDRSWLMVRYSYQIALLYVLPITYAGSFFAGLIVAHPSLTQLLVTLFALEILYLLSALYFRFFIPDTLADPRELGMTLQRDIAAYSKLAEIMCATGSRDSIRFTYAVTSRLEEHLRDDRVHWKMLSQVKDRLRLMWALQSPDFGAVSQLVKGMRLFPDTLQMRQTVYEFVGNPETDWIDDFAYRDELLSPRLKRTLQFVATAIIGIVGIFGAIFAQDIREQAIAFLGTAGQSTYQDTIIFFACVSLVFVILVTIDRWLWPRLNLALVDCVGEEPTPSLNRDGSRSA